MTSEQFPLEDTLLSFRDEIGRTDLSVEFSFNGFLITGNTGSGKSAYSGAYLSEKFLKHQFGALVLCVKDNEAQRFIKYCKDAGRSNDVLHIRPGGEYSFDFLQYEGRPRYDGKTITSNIVSVLKAVINAENESSGRTNDAYWTNALDELLTNTVDLCLLSSGTVTVEQMYQIVSSAPKVSNAPMDDVFDRQFMEIMVAAKLNVDSEVFRYVDALPRDEKERLKDPAVFDREIKRRFEKVRILNQVDRFFFHSYRSLASKTRGIVESSFSGVLFHLLQEPVYSLFCNGQTSFTPEDVFKGKIIVLDIPVLSFGKAGQDCQRIFKYIFQSAMLRRNLDENNRPVVIWADEGHMLLLESDPAFLSTCREKRIANVVITQNVSNFHYNMSGDNADHRVKSLLSVLSTKILHANDHVETNEWASRLVGEAFIGDYSYNENVTDKFSLSRNHSFKRERMVPPEAFLDLKTGGRQHKGIAEAYVIIQGKPFHDSFHHRKITFRQKHFKPSKN